MTTKYPRQTYDPADVPDSIKDCPAFLIVEVRDYSGKVWYRGEPTFRHFNTGSWGWMDAGKMPVPGAEDRRAQINVQLVVIGSKPGSDKGPKP